MASSYVMVGPSSGPIHFAALCGLPQVTWVGKPVGPRGVRRYTQHWNPFKVPVRVLYDSKWNPSVDTVLDNVDGLRYERCGRI